MSEVKFKEKVGYGLGDAASSMFWKLFGTNLLFFYTDVYGLSAAAVGTMFLVTRIWDSLLDPFVGVLADRTRSRWGKFRPYLLWFAFPFGLLGVMTFTVPDSGHTGKLVYAYITYGVMMIVYSMINVPYASLLGVMSDNPKTRTSLSSYRMIFAFIGSIIALFFIEPLTGLFGKDDEARGWQLATGVFAVLAIVFFLCTFKWTRERVTPVNEAGSSLKDDLKDLLRNRAWWVLLSAGIAAVIFNSIRDGAAVYYFKYYVGNDPAWLAGTGLSLTTLFLVSGQASNILGILLVTPVSGRIGKKNTFFGSMTIAGILSLVFMSVGKDAVWLMLLLQILISMCAGSIFPLLWSMYADIADYSELKTGRRATGLIFSSSSMSQKFGWALGGTLSGWLLAHYGFQANMVQDEAVLGGIRSMMGILPAVACAVSSLCVAFYPLSEKKVLETSRRLAALRDAGKHFEGE